MEKQSIKRAARRKLGIEVGDYVSIQPPEASNDRIYKIASIKSVESNTAYHYTVTHFDYNHMNYLCEKKYFRKATNFEVIVAKLKGQLYE